MHKNRRLFTLETLLEQGMSEKEAKKLLREIRNMRERERRLRRKSRSEITGIDIDIALGDSVSKL